METKILYHKCMDEAREILFLSEQELHKKCRLRILELREMGAKKCDCGSEILPPDERVWCGGIKAKIISDNEKEIKKLGLEIFKSKL